MHVVVNPKTGEEIKCRLTPKQIYDNLITSTNNFALSLCRSYQENGVLSDAQWFWFYKLGQEALIKEGQELVPLNPAFHEFVNKIFSQSKADKPRFGFLAYNNDSTEIVFIIKGIRSVYLKGKNGKFYGKLKQDWQQAGFEPEKECPQYVIDSLKKFAEDPLKQAELDGKVKGICMFCLRELTNDESVLRGYGPICAKRWGLPYDYSKQSVQV